jgi:hypothetical protein
MTNIELPTPAPLILSRPQERASRRIAPQADGAA